MIFWVREVRKGVRGRRETWRWRQARSQEKLNAFWSGCCWGNREVMSTATAPAAYGHCAPGWCAERKQRFHIILR